jgi:beta-glucanase (GH16 family)
MTPPSPLLLLAAALAALALPNAHASGGADDGQWRLVFEDEFVAPQLNASVWRVANNMTHGGQEWELYTSDNVYVEGGSLVLRTQAVDAVHGGRTYHFTSGWVDTLGLVERGYGKFEARIRLPAELPGLWPAYWLVDDNAHCWPVGSEIDILEAVGGFRDDSVFGTYHWGAACGSDAWTRDGDRNGDSPRPPGAHFSDAFHTFTAYFNATVITWAVDSAPYVSRVAGQPAGLFVPSWPLYTILNTALSFWAGPQPPPRDGYPAFMYVDYVRAWEWDGPSNGPGEFPVPFNATGLRPQLAASASPGHAEAPPAPIVVTTNGYGIVNNSERPRHEPSSHGHAPFTHARAHAP